MSQSQKSQAVAVPESREELIAQFAEDVRQIPQLEDDGFGMIADILNASTWEDLLGDSNGLPKAELVANRDLIVTALHRNDSDLQSWTPYYLIVTSTDAATGEVVRWQTSAGTVMAKLVTLHKLGALPVMVRLTKSQKPTKQGFYPMNMTVLAKG